MVSDTGSSSLWVHARDHFTSGVLGCMPPVVWPCTLYSVHMGEEESDTIADLAMSLVMRIIVSAIVFYISSLYAMAEGE